MKLVGLISGGKDSIYNLISCIEYGHTILCLANLFPQQTDELNSHMFQTVGHEAVEMIATAMNLPLIRHPLRGQSIDTTLHYNSTTIDGNDNNYDEIDDLYTLLVVVKKTYPEIQGVAAGAILSNYQRIRVERICSKLGLTCYAYLWQRDQVELLEEMCSTGKITPVLIKLATPNLPPKEHLMQTLQNLQPKLLQLFDQYGMNVCGEGGEYESLVLDSCLQSKSLHVTNFTIIDADAVDSNGALLTHLTVPYARLDVIELVDKSSEDIAADKAKLFNPQINLECEVLQTTPQLTQLKCGCDSRSTSATTSTPAPVSLPPLAQQLQTNLTGLNPTALISRCVLFSDNITQLFAALQSYIKLAQNQQKMTIRPVFVMICIPDMKQFGAMNAQYSTVFPSIRPPARVCVQSALPYYTLDVIFITTQNNNCNSDDSAQHSLPQLQQLHQFSQQIDSCHVEGVSTWAPANIGPYSQYWRLNGVFLGAGQIGMFPPTMSLYNCIAKQFLQTIKNSVACIQAASDIHQLSAKNHVAKKTNSSSPRSVPSIGQFTSMLLTFDEKQVINVINAVLVGYPNLEQLTQIEKVEIFLTLINTLTAVPAKPVRSPTTHFDPIPLPIADIDLVYGTRGTLLNLDKESHQKLSTQQRSSEIAAITEYLLATPTTIPFFPPIITTFDSDYTESNSSEDDDDDDDGKPQAHQLTNSSAAMIFVSAEMLPRGAAFELCSVGITNHVFKALADRSPSSQLPTTLSQLRWISIDPTTGAIFVSFAIFISGLYIDLVIFQLCQQSDEPAPLTQIPPQLLTQIYTLTNCAATTATPPSSTIPSTIDIIQSQLFVPSAQVSQAFTQVLEPHTNIYPTSQLFDQLNLDTAKLYTDTYLRLLNQKGKQFKAIADYLEQNPTLTTHQDVTSTINTGDGAFFYPRPAKSTHKCLCSSTLTQTNCSICQIKNKFSTTKFSIGQIYHVLMADPTLLTSLETLDSE